MVEFILFSLAVVVVGLVYTSINGIEPANRDLIDTDGYMRYLRLADLLDDGEWFDSISERSNYPFGESQHWTRALDIYLVALTFLVGTILRSEASYWASFINAPLLLIVGSWVFWREVRKRVPSSVSHLVLPVLLGLPLVLSYSLFGRVDHHIAILLAFITTFVYLLRVIDGVSRADLVILGLALTSGLWLSTEFLVPITLTCLTIAVLTLGSNAALSAMGAKLLSITSVSTGVILLVERGSQWTAVEYDKLSFVHLTVLVAGMLLFYLLRMLLEARIKRPWIPFLIAGLIAAAALAATFPGLVGGPFVEVDDRVAEMWLYRVGELRPFWAERSWSSRALVVAPTLLGVAASGLLRRRRALKGWLGVSAAWLLVYASLSMFQVRWAFFAHVLAIGLIVSAIGPWYERLDTSRLVVLVRPILAATLIFGTYGLGRTLDAFAPEPRNAVRCALSDVLPTLQAHPRTTVLAEQDVGPEILYRTDHNVIATPYHRNEAGILYVHDVMSMPVSDPDAITERLRERSVGLILMCPERFDTLRPENLEGTLYEALATGASPEFIRRVDLDVETDYLLFAVEN